MAVHDAVWAVVGDPPQDLDLLGVERLTQLQHPSQIIERTLAYVLVVGS